ncbi:Vacuolar protein sorting-associated protein vps5 [Exophiala xenobiotica]|uniref:Vacuolar protein sorting-associated protein vps5 n=1 Tax=Lithohypha guttulata TaxID=1690604 RepID=A0ABR0K6C3_9EURO|nr:Vacuolar protein sorting-associated protein vps5 [Lithohypha guttulata]KAK5315342.1 Vacuolar protein sorting-associated protein vps5 [Exophiala xenobiotica]
MDDSPWDDVPSQAESSSKEGEDAPLATATDQPAAASTSTPAPESKPATNRSAGGRKAPAKKALAQSTILQSVDDALDPLGPLGAAESAPSPSPAPAPAQVDQAPTPPRKETGARQVSGGRPPPAAADDVDNPSIRSRGAPPIHPPGSRDGSIRQGPPSMSLEQAAKPTFDILVGDPHKVGDLTSSHIVYQVRTKTSSKAYKQPEFAVSRRYRDFLWLYTSMHSNNPGVVIPPPPEKQAVGRFDTEFVESRRQALERMLNKIAAHPILHHDADLKIFLESEAFNVDVKNKENRDPLLDQSNKGMLSAIGINVGSSSGKFVEHDDWFHDRKIYLDALEIQLKALMKALDTVLVQRKGLAEAAGDFATSLAQLAQVELSPTFSGPLHGLSEVQVRIKELYQRQAQQDVLTLGITIDEYVRLIGSVKTAFGQRQKAYHSWHAAESELQKRRNAHDKLLRQGRSQQDKLNEVSASVSDAEKRAHQARLLFEDMGRLMRNELERFEREKVEDFKSGVETFLEGAVEAQKELIELWETFLLQMDADEGEPLGRPSAAAEQTTTGTTSTSEDQSDSHPTEENEQEQRQGGPVATAADVALEQDA